MKRGLVGDNGTRRKLSGTAVGELVVIGLGGISVVRIADSLRDSASCGRTGEDSRLESLASLSGRVDGSLSDVSPETPSVPIGVSMTIGAGISGRLAKKDSPFLTSLSVVNRQFLLRTQSHHQDSDLSTLSELSLGRRGLVGFFQQIQMTTGASSSKSDLSLDFRFLPDSEPSSRSRSTRLSDFEDFEDFELFLLDELTSLLLFEKMPPKNPPDSFFLPLESAPLLPTERESSSRYSSASLLRRLRDFFSSSLLLREVIDSSSGSRSSRAELRSEALVTVKFIYCSRYRRLHRIWLLSSTSIF